MHVTATVMNGDRVSLEFEAEDPCYGDVLERLDINPEAAVVVVDGRPVPEAAPIEQTDVTVMRTVSGGSVPG